jgi:ketosteroid isomerase-like protein
MSQENVEIVRRFLDAYNRRDHEAMVELIDPTFEFRSRFVGIESVHRASEGFPYTYFEMLDDAYEHFQVVLVEYHDAGAAVLAAGQAVWRGRASGAEAETAIFPTFWLRAGKVFRAETFDDRAEALEAVGLSEQDAHADS